MAKKRKSVTKAQRKKIASMRRCVTVCFKHLPLSGESVEREAIDCIKACKKRGGRLTKRRRKR